MNPYARAHSRTIELTLANMQRTSEDYKLARDAKVLRSVPKRRKKVRKRCHPSGYFAAYKRKYGLYVDGIAYLLKITHKEVHDLERKGILKHRIILAKMKK